MKFTGEITPGTELGVKRFRMPGVALVGECPSCKKPYEDVFDGRGHHLDEPCVGKPFTYYCYCEHCDHDWQVKVKLTVTLEMVSE